MRERSLATQKTQRAVALSAARFFWAALSFVTFLFAVEKKSKCAVKSEIGENVPLVEAPLRQFYGSLASPHP